MAPSGALSVNMQKGFFLVSLSPTPQFYICHPSLNGAQHHYLLKQLRSAHTTIIIQQGIPIFLDVLVDILRIMIIPKNSNLVFEKLFLYITCLHTVDTLPSVAMVGLSG